MKKYRVPLLSGIIIYLLYHYWLASYYQVFNDAYSIMNKIPSKTEELLQLNSGREASGEDVYVLLRAIDSLNIADYNFYGSFKETNLRSWFYLNAASWPVHLDTTSRNYIGLLEELERDSKLKVIFKHKKISIGSLNY